MRWALLLALLSLTASAQRPDRLGFSPRLDRRDRLGASSAASGPLLALSLLPPDSECSGTAPTGVTFTRASAATCIRSDGVAVALATNQARVHSTLGLLVEGAATNSILQSRDATGTAWNTTGCDKIGTGMDGAIAVARCSASAVVKQTITVATGSRVASVYIRGAACYTGGLATISANEVVSPAVDIWGSTWRRLSVPYTSNGNVTIAIASPDCAYEIDYAQDEAGAIATSPIVTAGTAATRAGEAASVSSSGMSTTTGCIAVTVETGSPSTNVTVVQMNVNSVGLQGDAGSMNSTAFSPPAPATATSSVGTVPTPGVPKRYAAVYSPGSLQVFSGASGGTVAASFAGWGALSAALNIGSRAGGTFAGVTYLSNLVIDNTTAGCGP